MECEPGLKESKAASDEQPLPPGGGLSGRPACSSSLDNPELFQEDSPKKINRPMASRWTDNLAYPKERQERSLREQGPLRQEGAKMPRLVTAQKESKYSGKERDEQKNPLRNETSGLR